MNQNLETPQSENILSPFTNPTPIKRGRGRPRMTAVTNTIGNINIGGSPGNNPLISQVSQVIVEEASTVPTQTLSTQNTGQ